MNSKVNIGEVLSKAWQIVWKFKVLWIFGILAGCAGGNNSRYNFNNGSFNNNQNYGSGSTNGQFQQFFRQFQGMQPGTIFQDIMNGYGTWITSGIVLLCVLWLVFLFLGFMGRIGLIRGASQADTGAQHLSFGQLWSESTPYFWRMFLLNLLVGLPFFLLIVIMLAGMGLSMYSLFASSSSSAGPTALVIGMGGVFVCAICLIAIAAFAISLVVEQAQNAIVLEDLGVMAGLRRGWQVFKSAVLTILLMTLILGVISGVAGFLIALPMIAVVGAAAVGALGTFAAGAKNMNFTLPVLLAAGCVCLYLPVLLAFSGILQAYSQSVWTLIFRRLTVEPLAPAAPASQIVDVESLR